MAISKAVEKMIKLGKGKAFRLENPPQKSPAEVREALEKELEKRGALAKFEVKKIPRSRDFNIVIKDLKTKAIPKPAERVKYESARVALDEMVHSRYGWKIADEIAEYVEGRKRPIRSKKEFVAILEKSLSKLPEKAREELNLNRPTMEMIRKEIWRNPDVTKSFADIADVRIRERKERKAFEKEKNILRAFENFWVQGIGKPTYKMLAKKSGLSEKILREFVPRLRKKGYPVSITKEGRIPEVRIPVRLKELEKKSLPPEFLKRIPALKDEAKALEKLIQRPPKSIARELARQGVVHPLTEEEIERIRDVQMKRLELLKKEMRTIEREQMGLSKIRGRKRRRGRG